MPPILNRGMKVIIPLVVGALGIDALLYFSGQMSTFIFDAWIAIGALIIFTGLYSQMDVRAARMQKGLNTDVLNYLWVPPSAILIVIATILLPAQFGISLFTYIALIISAVLMVMLYVLYEADHPGWVAQWVDEDNLRIIKQARATNQALNDEGVRQVTYGFLYLGIALGAVLGMLTFTLMFHELFWLLVIISMVMGALVILGYTGGWKVKKSCIDGKPLEEV